MSSPVRVPPHVKCKASQPAVSVRLMAASLVSVTFSCSAYSPALDPQWESCTCLFLGDTEQGDRCAIAACRMC